MYEFALTYMLVRPSCNEFALEQIKANSLYELYEFALEQIQTRLFNLTQIESKLISGFVCPKMSVCVSKCGDITTSINAGHREYFINCVSCGSIFLTFEKFTKHVESIHSFEEINLYPEYSGNEIHDKKDNIALNIEVLNICKEEAVETYGTASDIECDEAEECYSNKLRDVKDVLKESVLESSNGDKGTTNDPTKIFDKETMIKIFSDFEKHSILWDTRDPVSKNKHLRTIAYQTIASDVGKSSQWKNVKDLIVKLNLRLRNELDRKRNSMICDVDYTPLWIKDIDHFLRIRKENRKYMLPPSILTDLQRTTFINIYKSLTCLWNEMYIEYRLSNKRQEAMLILQDSLQNSGISLTQSEIEQEIDFIRKICWQEKKRKFKCEDMGTAFVPQYADYKQIQFLEVDVGPFRCEICKEVLPGLSKYKIHKSKHDGIKPFNCSLCNVSFTTVNNLNIHMTRHTGEHKYVCKYCNRRFRILSQMTTHERSHTGERPYLCDECGQTFRIWAYYDKHMRRHQNRADYECRICSKKFFAANALKEHMGIHRTERNYVCKVCGKSFKMSKNLRQHMQIHSSKKYICTICNKEFSQKAGLTGHMKTHGTSKTV